MGNFVPGANVGAGGLQGQQGLPMGQGIPVGQQGLQQGGQAGIPGGFLRPAGLPGVNNVVNQVNNGLIY